MLFPTLCLTDLIRACSVTTSISSSVALWIRTSYHRQVAVFCWCLWSYYSAALISLLCARSVFWIIFLILNIDEEDTWILNIFRCPSKYLDYVYVAVYIVERNHDKFNLCILVSRFYDKFTLHLNGYLSKFI